MNYINSLNINLKQLDQIQEMARVLKKGFLITELKLWTASSFAAELCFQITHLSYSIINKEQNTCYIVPFKGTDKGISDETADILFNIMNLANLLGLSITKLLSQDIISQCESLFNLNDIYIQTINLSIQTGNLWDATFRQDGYKHKIRSTKENEIYIQKVLAGVLISLLVLAKRLKINILDSFLTMFKDANQFLNDFTK